ncbi:MAG TPA: sigma factor-like helix-turn-helix DNA-binding protein [Armatimonadota bacterium]|jgi:DNA-binding NarL/FixJ family response regulator
MDTSTPGSWAYQPLELRIYSEETLDRKLRKELLLLDEPAALPGGVEALTNELLLDQLRDLALGLGLSRRQQDILLLRAQGWTVREIADLLGLRRQSVEHHCRGIRDALGDSLEQAENRIPAGRVPHYGWQQVFLDSQRRR